jgi:hypothetical protein
MKTFVVTPVPIHTQRLLGQYLGHNEYRFVFYAYGTTELGPPHYELHILKDCNLLAEIFISNYVVGPAVSYAQITHS